MQVNTDLSQNVFENSTALEWNPSPLPGVDRRMLERSGDEVAVCATIVRYAPNSTFDAHTHAKGEEFIVLDGVFSDEHADYPKGTYVRNPKGTSHAPHCKEGCTIFVRLRQFDDSDTEQKVIDTHNMDPYQLVQLEGEDKDTTNVFFLLLHEHMGEVTSILQIPKNTQLPQRTLKKVEEYFVLNGSATELSSGENYQRHSWGRRTKGSTVQFKTGDEECIILLREGRQLEPEC